MNELDVSSLPTPPAWSLATGQAGRVFVLLAAVLFSISAISWLFGKRSNILEKVGKLTFTGACASIFGAFVALVVLFVNNRFEFEYVYGHSDTKNAVQYRIAGIWSGQEGSFLLWAVCTALFSLLTIRLTQHYRRWATITASVFLASIAGILAFESPFRLTTFEGKAFMPFEGMGLAPSLQNYWVVIHPPTIFLGFGSLTVLFALATAALVERDYDSWIPIVRPWTIVSVSLVGLGLCMGGFWAYETLGWGGFWMWDPVENVSFVPWVFGIAFLHGMLVQAARKKWHMSNLLFGGLPFLAFVYGTFLTRSGFLSDASVHSFAEMDQSALKILLAVMGVFTLGFLGLWGFRCFQARPAKVATEAPGVGREGFYVMGVTALLVLGTATMIGMSVPLFQALKGEKPRVVEEGLYHQVLVWIFVPLMLLMAVTPFVSWRKLDAKAFWGKVYTTLCITIGLTGLLVFLSTVTPFGKQINMTPTVTMLGRFEVKGLAWPVTLLAICLFALVGNVVRLSEIVRRSKMGVAPFFAHIGVAMLMVGLVTSRAFERKDQGIVMADHPTTLLGYELRYQGMSSVETDRENTLKIGVYDAKDKSKLLFTATPGVYKVSMADGQTTTMVWPYIRRTWLMDTYIALGQPQSEAGQDVTLHVGESTTFGGLTLKYQESTRQGEFGMAGTKFGAKVLVNGDGKPTLVNPTMEIAGGGSTIQHPAPIDKSLQLAMVGMNAADKSVTLRMQFTSPLYPVEVFHKPLTLLVWLGTGVMTLSGFLAAYYRRSNKKVSLAEEQPAPVPQRKKAAELVTARQQKTT